MQLDNIKLIYMSKRVSKYIVNNYYDLLTEWESIGINNSAVARLLINKDETLKELKVKNLSRIIKRLYKDLQRTERVMVYDIETTLNLFRAWNTGKTYLRHDQMQTETQIMTVAWKWLGSNKVHYLKWEDDNDESLMIDFLEQYNKADVVIGWNNKSFDNKIVNTRALKHRLEVNTYVKSFDVMLQAKKEFRQPSNSMAYYVRFLGLKGKLNHAGIKMWEDIQFGEEDDSEEAMKIMIKYNVQDVALTEEIYYILRPYLTSTFNVGAFRKGSKTLCPNCGKDHSKLYKTTTTPVGTIQRVMKCSKCETKFKISNTSYLKTL